LRLWDVCPTLHPPHHAETCTLVWHLCSVVIDMVTLMKLLGLLFGSLSIMEILMYLRGSPGSFQLVKMALDHAGFLFNQHGKHYHEEKTDEEEHYRNWDFHDKDNAMDVRCDRFHITMRARMMVVRQCHQKCGGDRSCHEKCPKPWQRFKTMCDDIIPIATCHRNCMMEHLGQECHKGCPWPTCPKIVKKVKLAVACHESCKPGDRACHHQCPHPAKKLFGPCAMLGKAIACHRECSPGDFMCHHGCPKMRDIWHRHHLGHRHHGHHRRHGYRHHGHRHYGHRQTGHKLGRTKLDCHNACGVNITCHMECAISPARHHGQHVVKLVQEKLGCHHACGVNATCHTKCMVKLAKYHDQHFIKLVQERMACHHSCGANHTCHMECVEPIATSYDHFDHHHRHHYSHVDEGIEDHHHED